jgi:hypothetical protein
LDNGKVFHIKKTETANTVTMNTPAGTIDANGASYLVDTGFRTNITIVSD